MRRALRSVIAMAAIGSLVSLPARVHAQRAAIQIVSMYMTTEQAYEAYNSSNAAAPPIVEAFPQGVASVGFYLHYRGATVKASYRVGFVHNGTEVRHGALHSFDRVAGETVLSIPADALQAKGAYKATLYVNDAAIKTVGFSVITTPTIDKGYMITAKAWEAFSATSKTAPSKSTSFAAGVARVGAYFSYTGMAKADVYFVAVYDANGTRAHRSLNHTAQYVPNGAVAIILPADAGSYPRGKYRTDLYVNGAMVKSVPWSTR